MNRKSFSYATFIVAIFFSMLAAGLYAASGILYYDGIGFFEPKLLFVLSAVFATLSVLSPIVISLFSTERDVAAFNLSSVGSLFPLGVMALCSTLQSVNLLLQIQSMISAGTIKTNKLFFIVSLLSFLFVMCLLFCAIFSCLYPKEKFGVAAAFRLLSPLYFAVYTGYLYFSLSFSLSSPVKITHQMALLSLAIFFLAELRLSMQRIQKRFYLCAAAVAGALSLYVGIGVFVTYFVRYGTLMAICPEEILLTASAGGYAICRFFAVMKTPNVGTSPLVKAFLDVENTNLNE